MKIQLTFIFQLLWIAYSFGQASFEGSFKRFQVIEGSFKELHVAYDELKEKHKDRIPLLLIQTLDPDQKLIYHSDLELIKNSFKPEVMNNPFYMAQYLEIVSLKFSDRLNAKMDFIKQLSNQDFNAQDSILFKYEPEEEWPSKKAELEQSWLRKLKFESIISVDFEKLKAISQKEANELLNEAFRFSVSAEICKLENDLSGIQATVEEAFFKAYCNSFDPHSDYFSISNSMEFINQLSTSSFGPGISYVNSGNQFYISEVTPFSEADLSDSIEVGDELTAVYLEGEFVSPQCIPSQLLFDLFYGTEQEVLKIELKSSKTKVYQKFDLLKMELASVDNHTYCYELELEGHQYGYVSFPSFYTDFTDKEYGSGQEMALILLKLKKYQLEGLIVDLRDNGGGSIEEAVNLSSAFVDYGPLFITKKKALSDELLVKDTKKGKLFDGKIIFLVNSGSASASEILANAMQNYPNMLVVGSTTFGKATGQTMVPLFTAGGQEPFGMVKVSSLRIYNIDGKSYQGRGVVPDVLLPLYPTKRFYGEAELLFALENKDIKKSVKPRFKREIDSDKLQDYLDALLKEDSLMQSYISSHSAFENDMMNGIYYSIQLDSLQAFQVQDTLSERKDESFFNIALLEDNQAFKVIGEEQIKKIQSDITLRNTLQLFNYWNTREDE